MNISKITTLTALAACAGVLGCSRAAPDKPPPVKESPPISQKVRVENLQARTEKSYSLSGSETIKIVIVPGYPFGERCVIYSNANSSTMQCREITPGQQ